MVEYKGTKMILENTYALSLKKAITNLLGARLNFHEKLFSKRKNPIRPAMKFPIETAKIAITISSDFFTKNIISKNEMHFEMKVTTVIERIFCMP